MLDIGWSELLIIGILALLVVGPKELPGLLRTVGRYVGKARSVAREFQRSMEDAAREADINAFKELRDTKRDLDRMSRVDFSEQARRSQASLQGRKPAQQPEPGATAATKAELEAKAAAAKPAPPSASDPAAGGER